MSDFPESDFDSVSVSSEAEEIEYTQVDEARTAHRRLFTLSLLALILAIIAFFFPRCDFDDDGFGAGTGLTDEQLLQLIEENCVIPGVTGPAGEDGAPGSSGADGEPGAAGEDGAPGSAGATGSQGPAGATGETGSQGSAGATGSQGPAGETGATGAQGEQGVCGPIGAIGPAGATGATGEPGPAGPQGDPGPTGPQGIQGVAGPAGPRGATGPAGPPGTGGLGYFGSFWDQCTQFNATGAAIPMLFSHTGVSNGVTVDDADGIGTCAVADTDQDDGGPSGSPGGSEIRFPTSGVYNIQFSAQYEHLQGGTESFVEVWIRKNGTTPVPWSNTHYSTIANSVRSVAIVNWFVDVECTFVCDYYEVMWRPVDKNDPTPDNLGLIADSINANPAIPSIILTVNQVG